MNDKVSVRVYSALEMQAKQKEFYDTIKPFQERLFTIAQSKPAKGVVMYNDDGSVKHFQMIEPEKTEEEIILQWHIDDVYNKIFKE